MKPMYTVKAIWDEEAKVYAVVESDVPGLATEAESIEALQDKLKVLIPELIELNKHEVVQDQIPYQLCTEQFAFA